MNSNATVGDLMNTATVHLTRATTSMAVASCLVPGLVEARN